MANDTECGIESSSFIFVTGGKPYGAHNLVSHDLEQVCRIENAIYPFPWSLGNFKDSLAAGYDAWVIRQGLADEIVAYAVMMWIPDEAHLLNISVALKHQGKGLGLAILKWLSSRAINKGANRMVLEVRPSNLGGQRLYGKAGFVEIGRRRAYYPNGDFPREDALVLALELS